MTVRNVNSPTMSILDDIRSDRDAISSAGERRDKRIAESRRAGYPWADIAAASGLTRQATMIAAKRANGGVLPKPEPRK